jgi:hypothetical protein
MHCKAFVGDPSLSQLLLAKVSILLTEKNVMILEMQANDILV